MARVKAYDLCSPKGLERNDLRLLRNHLGGFARQAGIELSTMLHRNCSVALTGEVESTWRDVLEMIDRRPYVATFTLSPLSGSAVLALPQDSAVRMLELRLGGGHRPAFADHDRLTDCDLSIVGAVVAGVVDTVGATIARAGRVAAALGRQLADNQFHDLASPTDLYLVACFNLALGDDPMVEMLVALPYTLVHQILELLRPAAAASLGDDLLIARDTVLEVPLGVSVELPPVELTQANVAALAVGDVIRLGHPLDRPVSLKAERVTVARGQVGRSGARVACVVAEVVVEAP